jgi:hypothetical protein
MVYFLNYILRGPILFFASLLAIVLLCLCLFAIYCRTLHPLANVPGPFTASFSRFWLIKHSHAGDMHRTMIAMHEKYGSLVRIGHNEVSISDPQTIKTVYGAGSKYAKSDWYSVWQGHRKFDLFAERDEKLHGRQRALVSRAYSMTSLYDLEQYVDDTIKVFLEKMAEAKGQVDLGKWVQLYAFGECLHLSKTLQACWRKYSIDSSQISSGRSPFLEASDSCRRVRTMVPSTLLSVSFIRRHG